jgi:phosphatidylinositol 3-kinase
VVDANILDIKPRSVHEHFLDRLKLEMTEDEVIKHFESLLLTSYPTAMLDMAQRVVFID